MQDTTTIRVSRRTRKILSQVAVWKGRTLGELLEELAERERRQQVLDQSVQRMTEIMTDPEERAAYLAELHQSEDESADARRA
jgi:hypothetical protein